MKTLVVYYSRTGHNEQMAQQLQNQVAGDLDHIVDLKNREGMFGCVMAAMMRAKTKIEYGKDPSIYDQVVVVTPMWGGLLPPATRTYLTENRGKIRQFSVLSVCGRGEENTNALNDIAATAKLKPLSSLLIKEEEVGNETSKQKYNTFVEQLPH